MICGLSVRTDEGNSLTAWGFGELADIRVVYQRSDSPVGCYGSLGGRDKMTVLLWEMYASTWGVMRPERTKTMNVQLLYTSLSCIWRLVVVCYLTLKQNNIHRIASTDQFWFWEMPCNWPAIMKCTAVAINYCRFVKLQNEKLDDRKKDYLSVNRQIA